MTKPAGFIVVYDDDQGLTVPYGWDPACDGAIESTSGTVAFFPTRKAARRAVTISQRYARLCEAQGAVFNEDFMTGIKNVKVWPLVTP